MAVGLVLVAASTDAGAYYYGRHYGYYGHHYRPYYGHYYRPYYGGYYSIHGHHGHGHHGHGHHHGVGGLLYGILSIPAYVVGSIFGYHPHHGGHATSGDSTPQATEPEDSGGSYDYNSSSETTDNGGWARLADGRYRQALGIFANEASSRPTEGRPKVGYALSAAAGGDLRRGVWAMRRALRIDPDAMHYVTVEGALRQRVEQIVARYVEDPYETLDDAEATFMLASLYYILREPESARNAIKVAFAGDHSLPSTANLKRIIERDLAHADDDSSPSTTNPERLIGRDLARAEPAGDAGAPATEGESRDDDY